MTQLATPELYDLVEGAVHEEITHECVIELHCRHLIMYARVISTLLVPVPSQPAEQREGLSTARHSVFLPVALHVAGWS